MGSAPRRGTFPRVLVDLNTQCDFLLSRGALPVANREQIIPTIRRIMAWARIRRHPVISSLDAHRLEESPNGLPRHCVDHTPGQRKMPFTLLPRRLLLHGDNTFDVPLEPFRRYNQLIFTKRSLDFLSNPKADRLINEIDVQCFVLFGVVTEHCVKAAVLGLMARGRHVAVVTDACGHWSRLDAELALRQMEAKGAQLLTAEELVTGAADERLDAGPPRPMYAEEESDAALPTNGKPRLSGAILLSRDRMMQPAGDSCRPEGGPSSPGAGDSQSAGSSPSSAESAPHAPSRGNGKAAVGNGRRLAPPKPDAAARSVKKTDPQPRPGRDKSNRARPRPPARP